VERLPAKLASQNGCYWEKNAISKESRIFFITPIAWRGPSGSDNERAQRQRCAPAPGIHPMKGHDP
jgi:hypothetical protein